MRPVEGPTSGPAVYYEVMEEDGKTLVRSAYRPGMESVVMGMEVPEPYRQRARRVRWRWRVRDFPAGGDECRGGKADSAAAVNVVWKRGLRWYILKYVWSTEAPRGVTCDERRTVTLSRDTVVLERNGERGQWHLEIVDLRRAFLDHFARGDTSIEVPELVGIGLASDGDQTHSASGADFAELELELGP